MTAIRFSRRRLLAAALLGVPSAAIADGLWWEPGWVKTRRRRLTTGKPSHRLVHFTDLHHKGDRKYLEGVISRINRLSPDFICFTGDLVEDAAHLPEALELLQTIRAPVYGVPGNHDYWSHSDFGVIAKTFATTGGAWLLDESREVKAGGLIVHGATCNKPIALKPDPGRKNIMLLHYPVSADELAGRFDLVLAGHSHGGQVRIPFYGPVVVPFGVGGYDLGWFSTKGGPLYVSSGIGWFYANIRFNCRPEVVLIEL
jgi:predicted MPP superfamily phosphohydrolase